MRINRLAVETKEQAIKSKDDTIDLSLLDPLIQQYKNKKGNLIPLLQGTQNIYSYIPAEAFCRMKNV